MVKNLMKTSDTDFDASADLTSEELKAPLLDAILTHVAFDGWTHAAIRAGAEDLGISEGRALLVFETGLDALLAHKAQMDDALTDALAKADMDTMRIRDRITFAVRTRFELMAPYREAERRAATLLAMPHNAPLAAKAIWKTVDIMWRAAGDTATDFNHYSKRTILGAVYSSTFLIWIGDDSEDCADTWAFLDRRIEGVMKFEKVKAKARQLRAYKPSLARFLGRLRYGDGS